MITPIEIPPGASRCKVAPKTARARVVLLQVARLGQSATDRAIARAAGLSRGAVSHYLSELEKGGWIARFGDNRNRLLLVRLWPVGLEDLEAEDLATIRAQPARLKGPAAGCQETSTRRCLLCRLPFESEGVGNRRCRPCLAKARNVAPMLEGMVV